MVVPEWLDTHPEKEVAVDAFLREERIGVGAAKR
jgi:hypothetical protein